MSPAPITVPHPMELSNWFGTYGHVEYLYSCPVDSQGSSPNSLPKIGLRDESWPPRMVTMSKILIVYNDLTE